VDQMQHADLPGGTRNHRFGLRNRNGVAHSD
jgi:hypothetical protein